MLQIAKKLPEFIQKCSLVTLEQTLTWIKDFKNPKLFSSMLIWNKTSILRQKWSFVVILLYHYKKLKKNQILYTYFHQAEQFRVLEVFSPCQSLFKSELRAFLNKFRQFIAHKLPFFLHFASNFT